MKFQSGSGKVNLSRAVGVGQHHGPFARPYHIKVNFSEADNTSRRVKIRAAVPRTPKAARVPEFFPAGLTFRRLRILRTVELPRALPGPARKMREPIDWGNGPEAGARPRN
jgi:hypothetical protein